MSEHNTTLEGRVTSLEVRMAVNESEIKNVREDIKGIKDDTKFLRRTITGALVTSGIGGAIGLIYILVRYVLIQQ